MNKYQDGEEEGESITLTDSSNMNVVELSIEGNSKQEKRSGSNMLNFDLMQSTRVTVNADGTLTINGAGGFGLNIKKVTLQPGVSYYQKYELVSGSITGVNSPFLSFTANLWIKNNDFVKTEVAETKEVSNIWVHDSAVFENAVIKLWANTDQSEFEAYGAMPSPSYPSEVETVNTQVNIVVENEDSTEQQTKVVDIQKQMLQGDYFVKEEDGWKEVNGWNKKIFDGTENFRTISISGITDKYYFGIQNFGDNMNYSQKCNYFRGGETFWGNGKEGLYIGTNRELVFGVSLDNKEGINNLETWKNWLAQKHTEGNSVYVWYKLATPTRLACTEKQVQQLDDLLNTSTYKNVTHIYSTDKVSPVIKVVYRKDLETMLNNQQSEYETRLNNIEKLLSTTTTSSTLLDNLQKDIESEVI